ncbi:MAG: hypothetical protein HQK96_06890 [Nitrospirae bacterium]|nr:hypothetical protein [Nitrospirota bacterium]
MTDALMKEPTPEDDAKHLLVMEYERFFDPSAEALTPEVFAERFIGNLKSFGYFIEKRKIPKPKTDKCCSNCGNSLEDGCCQIGIHCDSDMSQWKPKDIPIEIAPIGTARKCYTCAIASGCLGDDAKEKRRECIKNGRRRWKRLQPFSTYRFLKV